MPFLQNTWYASAWSEELPGKGTLPRTIIDQPIVLFRNSQGIAALADRCAHRFAPLSMGKLTDAGIRCGYHGLEFDAAGRCVGNPHGPVLDSLRVRSYPSLERHGLVWVWFGSPERADPATIPDMSFVSQAPATAFSKGYLPTAASHLLLVDNILDLSHADYLHPTTLGGGSISRTRAHIEERERSLFVAWHAFNEVPIPIFKPLLPEPEAPCDMWTEVEWFPSGVMILRAGAAPVGAPREAGIDTWNAHIMTPEGSSRTHYFYCNSRNYRVDDEEYNRHFAAGLRSAFELEDKPMIEAQQRRVGDVDLLEQKPALLPIDSASVRARRLLRQLINAEAAGSAA
jgi:phenylpropionate dioxygenase-like ring-hydroxylating dioxygenase large terminal subunit